MTRSGSKLRRGLLMAWCWLRLPLLAIVFFVLREPIVRAVEHVFDITRITLLAIDILSTPLTRGLVFVVLLAALTAWTAAVRRVRGITGFALLVAPGLILTAVAVLGGGLHKAEALLIGVTLLFNLLPSGLEPKFLAGPRATDVLMGAGVGFAESCLLRRYLEWLAERLDMPRLKQALSRTVVTSAVSVLPPVAIAATLLSGERLVTVEQALRSNPHVRLVARADFNWIELDASRRFLFATGHGVERLRRYDVTDWQRPPLESDVPSGNAQGFAYDAAERTLYVFNEHERAIQYFDADTLKLQRTVPLEQLSPGDPWIAVDRRTDTLTIVSEADDRKGHPFLTVDRKSGRIVAANDEDPGNIFPHPTEPLLYVSYFRRSTGVRIYDLEKRTFGASAPSPGRPERLVLWPEGGELLVTFPMDSRIVRMDPTTLADKGHIKTLFGVRALAVDPQRELLVCGSISTGKLALVELKTGRERASFYIGPWLRTIQVDAARGVAFVSSNGALYQVDYGKL